MYTNVLIYKINRINSVIMVSILASIVVDRGFMPWSCQTKDCKKMVPVFAASPLGMQF